MKGITGSGYGANSRDGGQERTRVKTSPSSPGHCLEGERRLQETVVLPFHFSEYPFLNRPICNINSLKTIINFKLNQSALKQLVSITHPNMVGIRKIVKTSPKESGPIGSGLTYYSLFYQPVQYNVKYLTDNPHQHPRLHGLLTSSDFKNTLCGLFQHLDNHGIYYAVRLQDIGISSDGILKVYIPPTAILDPSYSPAVDKALSGVLEWWNKQLSSLQCAQFKKDKKALQLQPPKLADNFDLELEDGSLDEGQLARELDGLLDDPDEPLVSSPELMGSTQTVSKVSSIQLDKMKQIDQKIKYFRDKLDQTRLKQGEKLPLGIPRKQEKPFVGTKQEKDYFRQPIQQNINCINIYNHGTPIPAGRFSALPNYYPTAYQPFLPRNTYMNNRQVQQQIYEQEDTCSQDTYDIEFQNQFEQPTQGPNNPQFRHSIFQPSQRDLSEHPKRKVKDSKLQDFRAKPNVNAVCNKNYTESAGPLQFKSFVSKYMKAGKPIDEQQAPAPQEPVSAVANCQSQRALAGLKSRGAEGGIRRNFSQNEMLPVRRKEGEIESKVRVALEKTKNAIAFLNRVKQKQQQKNVSMQ